MKLPEPLGPYSHFKIINGMVYTSGQIPTDNTLDIAGQTRQALTNLSNVLEAAGSGLEYVVKTTCFLKSMEQFQSFNEVYAEYFRNKPARSCVEVARLPKDVLVEIEAVAYIPIK